MRSGLSSNLVFSCSIRRSGDLFPNPPSIRKRLRKSLSGRESIVKSFDLPSGNKALRYREERIKYWNDYRRRKSGIYYHDEITRVYQFLVPPGRRVIELGCGEGDLLAALKPARGVGVDF